MLLELGYLSSPQDVEIDDIRRNGATKATASLVTADRSLLRLAASGPLGGRGDAASRRIAPRRVSRPLAQSALAKARQLSGALAV